MRYLTNFYRILCCIAVIFHLSFFTLRSSAETVDRIVAVVNEQVITLTDLRIAEAFGLYDKEIDKRAENVRLLLLEKMVNQKLVVLISSGESMEKEEQDSYLKSVIEQMGSEEFGEKLEELGLDREDLREYIREKIIYQKIINRRFGQGIIVSLEEIEDYYKRRYVPSQEKMGAKPKPMLEILNDIESALKQEKVQSRVEDWIINLKTNADILINIKS